MPAYDYHCTTCTTLPAITIIHGVNERPARDQRACPQCGNLLQKALNTTVAITPKRATPPTDNTPAPSICEQGHANCPGHALAEQLINNAHPGQDNS